jgi:hypothetical protein
VNEAAALHTAMRRYCFERLAELRSDDDDDNLGDDDDAAHRIDETDAMETVLVRLGLREETTPADWLPAQILDGLLGRLERADPETLTSLDQVEQAVSSAADGALMSVRYGNDEEVEQITAAEVSRFEEAFRAIDRGTLGSVEPLPYRRYLVAYERDRLWVHLDEVYGARRGAYFYPLGGAKPAGPVVVICVPDGADELFCEVLRAAAESLGAQRVFDLEDGDDGSVFDVELWEPGYFNAVDGEHITFDASCSWLVYASHEQTLTLVGEIVAEVEARIPSLDSWRVDPDTLQYCSDDADGDAGHADADEDEEGAVDEDEGAGEGDEGELSGWARLSLGAEIGEHVAGIVDDLGPSLVYPEGWSPGTGSVMLTGVDDAILLDRKLALARRILEVIATFPEAEHEATG